jgi:hypothetical protein
VKLQALVRGHLVRKQATATLRCMQALVNVQTRARAQRIWMNEDVNPSQRQSIHRKSTQENRIRHTNYVRILSFYSVHALFFYYQIVELSIHLTRNESDYLINGKLNIPCHA